MKKLLLLLLALTLCFCIACGDEEETPETPDTPSGPATPSDPTPVVYTVSFYDEEGNLLKTSSVSEGTVPSYTYNKADTAEWDYTVEGFATAQGGTPLTTLPAATANASYYAVVSRVKQTYTVTFDTDEKATVESVTVEYGESVSAPEAPEAAGYRFLGWCADASCTTPATFPLTVTENVTIYAKWNVKLDVTGYLETLLSGYAVSPYSYLPETMTPSYADNLVDADDLPTSFASAVNVSAIPKGGFGDQWQMILDNVSQSELFFNALTVVEGIAGTTIGIFNNYVDQNPSDTASHTFKSGIYQVTIDFDGETLSYVLDYTATFPLIGEQAAQIALSMDVATGDKSVRIQLGDANAMRYTVTENSYVFAIKYLGVRRAYIEMTKDGENTEGHIAEYLTVSSVEIASCADFYVTEDYVSAVGNKADAFLGFTGYINELYDVTTGRLLGYEVRETLSSITYNTLWFNLGDVSGLNSIRYAEANGDVPAAFFVNGSSKAWEARLVGVFGGLKAASRRFDIEFKTQYFYSYDAASDTYTAHAVEVPMLFVQEEYYEDLIKDVKSTNNVTVSVGVSDTDLTKLMADYDTLIDAFIANKESITVDAIIAYIGNKLQFA